MVIKMVKDGGGKNNMWFEIDASGINIKLQVMAIDQRIKIIGIVNGADVIFCFLPVTGSIIIKKMMKYY